MTTKEALKNAISALQYRIACVQPLIDSPYLAETREILQAGQNRDVETIYRLVGEFRDLELKP